MPHIKLKQGSPEYAEPKADAEEKICDMPGCCEKGVHKAPKHRGLNEYYYFCLEHARDYNKAWNFFAGMSNQEVQDHMLRSMYGDRPTWRYTDANMEDNLRDKVWSDFDFGYGDASEGTEERDSSNHYRPAGETQSAEFEALALMGLVPPVTLDDIKTRYKELAKKYHPDLNKGCEASENKLKKINMAYTILKIAYEEFEKLPKKG